jgi:U3 small nucleolar RNA-associated protein 22
MFTPELEDYDFVIRMSSASAMSDTDYKNLALPAHPESLAQMSINMTDELYKDLKRAYSESLLLFRMRDTSGKHRKDIITGLWREDASQRRKFKVNIGYSVIPVASDAVELNKTAILHEIQRIGGDLIKDINVRSV